MHKEFAGEIYGMIKNLGEYSELESRRKNELANYLEKLQVPFEITVRNDKLGEVKRVE